MSLHLAGAVVWGALGGLCLFRGFWRPHRAVAREGKVSRCAGQPDAFGVCDPSDVIEVPEGEPVYAAVKGKVTLVGDYFVHVASEYEPVILMYEGIEPSVKEGDSVGPGKEIGTSDGVVYFSVTEYLPQAPFARYLPPSAWLAARGMLLVRKNTGGSGYCTGGRKIAVPQADKQRCNLAAPDPANFALLPIKVEVG